MNWFVTRVEEASLRVADPDSILLDQAAQALLNVEPEKAEDLAANPMEWMATAPPDALSRSKLPKDLAAKVQLRMATAPPAHSPVNVEADDLAANPIEWHGHSPAFEPAERRTKADDLAANPIRVDGYSPGCAPEKQKEFLNWKPRFPSVRK